MATHGSDPEQPEREKRIEDLKNRAKELAGGEMIEGEINESSPEVKEGFWNYVVAWEEAPWTTYFKQLEEAGVSLPGPETLDDCELSLKLWEVIDKLATFRAYLHETNHLSDRELYTLLLTDILPEETKDLTRVEATNCQIPLLGSGSEEDTRLYLKFYADEKERHEWQNEFSGETLPEHEDPRYDRDQYLHAADYGPPIDLEIDPDDESPGSEDD
jgi:hypothetical protein